MIELTHLSPAQRKAYVIADNRLALDAGWDDELLAEELADLQAMDYDLALTGLDEDEVEDLLDPGDGGGEGSGNGYDGGAPVVAYNLIFDNEQQQARWYRFLKYLKTNAAGETVAARLETYLLDLNLPE